jgi:hypothetical protein
MPSGQTPSLFPGRHLRIAHWSTDPRLVDADAMVLESHLARLGDVTVERVKTLEDATAAPRDLLIVAAQRVEAGAFAGWLDGLKRRLVAQGGIWVPALILADVPFDVLSEILPVAAADNWYFDILAPAHAASLPIRVANLLRIHDHLHELKRYAAALDDITTKVTMLESQMRDLRGADTTAPAAAKPGAPKP